jgi:hypothetical protein
MSTLAGTIPDTMEPKYTEVLQKLNQKPLYLNSQDYRAFAIQQIAEQKRLVEGLRLKPE